MTDLSTRANAFLEDAEAEGEFAVILRFSGNELLVHCQRADDVLPLCRYVVEQYRAPEEKTLQ